MSRPRVYGAAKGGSLSRFLEPATLARLSNLDLMSRTVVEGFISGLHHSPFFGRSLDFAEHRQYMPGDDIRLIDWKLFARTDRFFVKKFEADTNTNCTILLDVSRSMRFARDSISKLDYGRYLSACLAYFAHKQRDRVGFATFDQQVLEYVPPAAKHLQEVLRAIDRVEPGGPGSLRPALQRVAGRLRRRSIVVLISDFYEEADAAFDAVSLLRGRGNDVIAFHLLDAAELRFPFEDAAEFEDLESSQRIAIAPETVRAEYKRLLEEHVATLRRRLSEARVDYHLFDTSVPLDFALYSYLSARQRAARAR
ncbi:MAG TPA: DUF58 domain-containing protein [Thermoanaerobaculia bacterium]|nr:DUF58 domain-containing protein [Thermoanaerobaculia bacterium]